jgi:hypothetical protein
MTDGMNVLIGINVVLNNCFILNSHHYTAIHTESCLSVHWLINKMVNLNDAVYGDNDENVFPSSVIWATHLLQEEAPRARARCDWNKFKELSPILTARGASSSSFIFIYVSSSSTSQQSTSIFYEINNGYGRQLPNSIKYTINFQWHCVLELWTGLNFQARPGPF